MFLRRTERKKNGKTHTTGTSSRTSVSMTAGWCSGTCCIWARSIPRRRRRGARRSRCSTRTAERRTLALFPEDRCEAVAGDASVVRLRLSEMRLHRPRQWGACWLAGQLWRGASARSVLGRSLPPSRKGTRWDQILQVLATYRLIAPGSEWRLHREWFGNSAMADLLGADFGLAEEHKLYACHDLLLAHKEALFSHLVGRWRDLFNADFDVLLYDLTSTYFEVNASDLPEGDKRRHGYSRDKRPDCPQVVIALVVTPDGLPLAYEVLPGNTADSKTLRMFLSKIEHAIRQGAAGLGDGSRRAHRGGAGRDAQQRSAGAISGGNAQGTPEPLGEAPADKPWQEAREGVEGQAAWPRTASSMSSRRAMIASPRNARCAGGS
jgi:hypothetical protein